jgi:hypothetical protein
VATVDRDRVVSIDVYGFQRSEWNKVGDISRRRRESHVSLPRWISVQTWFRLPFDNDNKPVFQVGSRVLLVHLEGPHSRYSTHAQNGKWYMYFRAAENQWLIDTAVEPEGVCFSTNKSPVLQSAWCAALPHPLHLIPAVQRRSSVK